MRFLKQLRLFSDKRQELFSEFSGRDDVKWTLQKALESEPPVHILLVGLPGLRKTRFVKAIKKEYPDLSYFALASGSTGVLSPPRFLLIDATSKLKGRRRYVRKGQEIARL